MDFRSKDRFLMKIELAQFTFLGFTELISHSSFSVIFVNCAFLAVSDFAIAASFMLLV